MNFNKHLAYEGKHAFLGASQYHWLKYSDEKLAKTYRSMLAKEKGTELHEFAAQCIKLGQKLPKSNKTLNLFVNDAIGFKMKPEVVLFHSENCFGTADAISFRETARPRPILRISDLKTGVTPAHMEQLEIYAALFCLEYRINPEDIDIELRLYQFDECFLHIPEPEVIRTIMNKIVSSNKVVAEIKIEEG